MNKPPPAPVVNNKAPQSPASKPNTNSNEASDLVTIKTKDSRSHRLSEGNGPKLNKNTVYGNQSQRQPLYNRQNSNQNQRKSESNAKRQIVQSNNTNINSTDKNADVIQGLSQRFSQSSLSSGDNSANSSRRSSISNSVHGNGQTTAANSNGRVINYAQSKSSSGNPVKK